MSSSRSRPASRASSASSARSSPPTTSARGPINAFTIAFQFPNLVRALVADAALSSAFVPVFSELIEKGERKRAWRVASSLFWLMLLGLTALTAIFILVAPWIGALRRTRAGTQALAVGLSRVLFPIVALLGVSGIVVGILNTYDHFTVPALSPGGLERRDHRRARDRRPAGDTQNAKLYVYAVSILVATVIQVLLPLPWLRGLDRGEERLRVVIDWRDPMVKQTFELMIPVTLGLGLINVNAVIDRSSPRGCQRRARADRDPEVVPRLHAPAGDVLGGDRDGALPVALAARDPRRHGRLPRHGLARASARSRSC